MSLAGGRSAIAAVAMALASLVRWRGLFLARLLSLLALP